MKDRPIDRKFLDISTKLELYSDYGDITGIQSIRRMIILFNENFEKIEYRLQQLEGEEIETD